MQVIDDIARLRETRAGLRGQLGLVPTMGALHDGHLGLVRAARAENDAVAVSIFINPTQFGPREDLEQYPRDLPRDLALLEAEGVDVVFTPTADLMYPETFRTYINVEELSVGLEGASRRGHFRGVATVVAKLFNLCSADRAYFGQKDAQQAVIIRRLVSDLNFPLEVVVCPTARHTDGLALSSRNVYLATEERAAATALYRGLQAARQAYDAGERRPEKLRGTAREVLEGEPLIDVDYVALTDPGTLRGLRAPSDDPLLLLIAVTLGKTRLLDNGLLPWSLNDRDGLTRVLGAT
ncbi:MAG: pantoate--beta-alanine ligase [Chloroflexi bacterium]|nr:pantoate--beta-alanine ligase [Chloroflexota bacterium]